MSAVIWLSVAAVSPKSRITSEKTWLPIAAR
jgi:hypothetical protein